MPDAYYRPQRSWGKVMFLHLSVILSTGGSATHTPPLGRHLPGQNPPPSKQPPWADAPLRNAYWDAVNKRAVRILLECNLV